jgi:hypothetical protein
MCAYRSYWNAAFAVRGGNTHVHEYFVVAILGGALALRIVVDKVCNCAA